METPCLEKRRMAARPCLHEQIFSQRNPQCIKVFRGVGTGSDHYLINIKTKFTTLKKTPKKAPKDKKLTQNSKYTENIKTTKLTDTLEELISLLKQHAEH